MNAIRRKKVLAFVELHPDSKSSLDRWYKLAKQARWRNLAELRKVYPHADLVGKYTVFNIRGNHYRVIAEINYQYQQILIREILPHAEYDKDKWKS